MTKYLLILVGLLFLAGCKRIDDIGDTTVLPTPTTAQLIDVTATAVSPTSSQEIRIESSCIFLLRNTAVIIHACQNMDRDGWFKAPVWSPDRQWLVFITEAIDLSSAGLWVTLPHSSLPQHLNPPYDSFLQTYLDITLNQFKSR